MQKKTLGGERLGSGKKMEVELTGYGRSTHDLSEIFRTTMSAGTLVPFLKKVMLPGSAFNIDLNCDVMTHPTIGPLFGSYKVQLDVFTIPIRLYNSLTHMNALEVGLDMSKVKFPVIELTAYPIDLEDTPDINTCQVNPSCLLAYLGIRGMGYTDVQAERKFNALPILMYWDIYKNYYSNKQEKIGAVVHKAGETVSQTVVEITAIEPGTGTTYTISQAPTTTGNITLAAGWVINIQYNTTPPDLKQVMVKMKNAGLISVHDLLGGTYTDDGIDIIEGMYLAARFGNDMPINWRYQTNTESVTVAPEIATFDLTEIDQMRKDILAFSSETIAFIINEQDSEALPYRWLWQVQNNMPSILNSQEGLGIKTYNSDLFNNWLAEEFYSYISAVSAVSTAGDEFTIDQLNLSKKVYDMLLQVAVSGGSYNDWIDTVYNVRSMRRPESPVYMGGLIKELVFQEVVSNSATEGQPLGTLAGKGRLSGKHKGGHVKVRVDEPSYVMGIVSITPRIDYSQGNEWDVNLQTMDDLHKPALDEIGFQDLITDQMCFWDTEFSGVPHVWNYKSAGKQPAWINYMTAINKTFGNFAIQDNEMFMTLNRRYEFEEGTGILDLTTYIDPTKFNGIFADTALDAQNFWVQISCDISAEHVMSYKIMPSL